ncbi:PTS system fructose-specific EIIABC component [bacterium HR20]|jgi:mannitol/fructose-specific phosphotransferase system IIA component (Ntr-type)|nr:PTS system fructose-specific EIIABC component [bacterium HR20]
MKIADVLSPTKIQLRIPVTSKRELLDRLLAIVDAEGELLDSERARQAVFEREERLSTGIGYGIAIPHAKTDAVARATAALVTCAQPVEYDSLDGKPVDIAILILGRSGDVRTHLQLLGKISRLVSSEQSRELFRHTLLQARTPNAVYEYFQQLPDSNNAD